MNNITTPVFLIGLSCGALYISNILIKKYLNYNYVSNRQKMLSYITRFEFEDNVEKRFKPKHVKYLDYTNENAKCSPIFCEHVNLENLEDIITLIYNDKQIDENDKLLMIKILKDVEVHNTFVNYLPQLSSILFTNNGESVLYIKYTDSGNPKETMIIELGGLRDLYRNLNIDDIINNIEITRTISTKKEYHN